MPKRCSIAETRDQLTRLVRDVENGETVELTRRGKPVAVLVSVHEYQGLQNGNPGFWEALCRFREEHDLEKLDIEFETSARLRDRSPGRKVKL